jgi:hypothetical protein
MNVRHEFLDEFRRRLHRHEEERVRMPAAEYNRILQYFAAEKAILLIQKLRCGYG